VSGTPLPPTSDRAWRARRNDHEIEMTDTKDPGATLVVRAAIAPLHAEPRISSAQVSQRLAGHSLAVLGREGEWMRVRGEDDYEGWTHRGYLCDSANGAPPRARLSLGCVVRERDRADAPTRPLPLGAWLAERDVVASGECVSRDALAWRFPRDAEAIARSAVDRFAGAPYVWGGITPWGADCSGLVQSVFALHAVALPRDAWQQAECGEPVADSMDELRAAELLFFSDRDDRRITHVGIALGQGRMVHLALGRGGYAVERLGDTSDGYVAKLRERYLGARRVV
jgi:hypothetical protein